MTKHKPYSNLDNETFCADPSVSDAPTVAEMRSLVEGMAKNTADIAELQKQLAELKGAIGSLSGSVAQAAPSRPQGAGEPLPVLVPSAPGLPDEPKPDFKDPTKPSVPSVPVENSPTEVTLNPGDKVTVSAPEDFDKDPA